MRGQPAADQVSVGFLPLNKLEAHLRTPLWAVPASLAVRVQLTLVVLVRSRFSAVGAPALEVSETGTSIVVVGLLSRFAKEAHAVCVPRWIQNQSAWRQQRNSFAAGAGTTKKTHSPVFCSTQVPSSFFHSQSRPQSLSSCCSVSSFRVSALRICSTRSLC